QDRERARAAHLALWPEAADAAVRSLDAVAAPVAEALVGGARGLSAGIPADADPAVSAAATAAHAGLLRPLEPAPATRRPDRALAALMSSAEGVDVDLGSLAEQADAERDRLTGRLAESCAQVDPDRPAMEVARGLVRDHPDAEGVLEAARRWTARAIDFTSG